MSNGSEVMDLLCLHRFRSGEMSVRCRRVELRIPLPDFSEGDLQRLTKMMEVLLDSEESRAAM